jgi:hypothetical protein
MRWTVYGVLWRLKLGFVLGFVFFFCFYPFELRYTQLPMADTR